MTYIEEFMDTAAAEWDEYDDDWNDNGPFIREDLPATDDAEE